MTTPSTPPEPEVKPQPADSLVSPHKWTQPVIAGVGPDAPLAENARGGKQSASPYRADLLPAKAVLDVSRILAIGAKRYAPNNWRKIDQADHLNHALVHILSHMAGDRQDEHLEHAACRMLMALETDMAVTPELSDIKNN